MAKRFKEYGGLNLPEINQRVLGQWSDEDVFHRTMSEREGCFKEFVTFVNNPDGSPKYEDTCVYAILEKEWNTIRQW